VVAGLYGSGKGRVHSFETHAGYGAGVANDNSIDVGALPGTEGFADLPPVAAELLAGLTEVAAAQRALLALQPSLISGSERSKGNQDAFLKNQETLLGNQPILLSNQRTMIANQEAFLRNQERLLGNQPTLLSNQRTMIANQEEFLRRQEKLLASQAAAAARYREILLAQERIAQVQAEIAAALQALKAQVRRDDGQRGVPPE